MRIFLTGSTGVIGRRAVPLLVAARHHVTAVARSPEKRLALERAGASAVTVDLFDPLAVRQAVHGHDAVINLAAAIAEGGARMIQESFAPIYADMGDRWIDETAPTIPARYNRAVLDAEAATERAQGVVLRFAYFYGPDSDFTRAFLASVRKGRAQLIGDPAGFWPMVSHDDAASAVVAALTVPAGIYNVVDDEPLRRRELVDSLAATLNAPPPKLLPAWLKYLLGSLGETLSRSQRISNRKLKAASGWVPRWRSAREGLAEVIADRGEPVR
ncbi:MAG: hypothetical protein DMD58_16705 [Gemmatimonadetes bacterium]|nr:MAG: hypothetical protein DMD58_16705 [Gemmatimonadota bacterium]